MPRATSPVGVRPPKKKALPSRAPKGPVGVRAPAPSGIFGPVAAPSTPGKDAAKRAQRRAGNIIAARPGVRALKPQVGVPDSVLVKSGARRLAAAGVTSPADRAALATSRAPAGHALRQIRAAKQRQDSRAAPPFVLANREAYLGVHPRAVAGRPHSKLSIPGIATIDLTNVGRGIMARTSLGSASAENAFAKNFVGDVGALGASPFIGGFEVAKIAGKAVTGDTTGSWRDAKRLGGGLWQGVSQSVPGRLVSGDLKGAERSFRQHPGFALLDAAGVESIAGRGLGAIARGAGRPGSALARAGSTARPAVALVNDAGAVARGGVRLQRGSKSIFRQTLLNAADARRSPLLDSQGRRVTIKVQGKSVPVLRSSGRAQAKALRRRGNFLASRATALEKAQRGTAAEQYAAVAGARKFRRGTSQAHQDLAAMVATGTVRSVATFESDLQKRAANIESNLLKRGHKDDPYATRGEFKQAQANLKAIRSALADPKLMAQKQQIVAHGVELAQALSAGDRALVGAKVLGGREAARTPLLEYAQAHQGARHVTEIEHKALEQEALTHERAAKAAFEAAVAHPKGNAYHRTSPDAAASIRREGFRTDRGSNGGDVAGVYASERQLAPGAHVGGTDLRVHVDLKNPLRDPRRLKSVVGDVKESLGHTRNEPVRGADLRAVRAEVTKRLQAQGFDGLDLPPHPYAIGGEASGRELVAFDPRAARVVPDAAALKAEWAAAREHRIAVSGRNVDRVKMHERLQKSAQLHEERVKPVASELEREKDRLKKLQDRARQTRMRDRAKVAKGDLHPDRAQYRIDTLTAAIDSAKNSVATLDKQARELGQKAAEARALARKSRMPETTAGFRTHDAKFLSDKAILDSAGAHGRSAADLAYLPHVVGEIGQRAFHQQFRPGTRPRRGGETRTGALYARGATAQNANLAVQELTRKQVELAKAGQMDKLVHEIGLRHPAVEKAARGEPLTRLEQRIVDRGGYFNAKEADEFARRSAEGGEHALIPVRALGAKLSRSEQAGIRADQNPAGLGRYQAAAQGVKDAINPAPSQDWQSRLDMTDGGARNVVLMPASLVNQLVKHSRGAGEAEKVAQMLNAPFRVAVLAQPRWLTGNFIEPYIVRLPMAGAGVNVAGMFLDVRAGRRVLTHMENSGDPRLVQAAAEIRAQQFGGMFVGNQQATVRRTIRDDLRDPATGQAPLPIEVAGVIRQMPVFKQFGDLTMSLSRKFFDVNRVIESFAQHQSFGKSAREEIQAFSGSWFDTVKLGQKSIDEVAHGLVGTPTQQRFMESQHELLGKYEGFGPLSRRLIQTVAPFIPWALSAARWVYWTMPVHHSATTAALIKISQNVLPQWEQDHKDVPPGSLSFTNVTKDGGLVDFARYTPYGLTAPITKGELGAIPGFVLPQVSGALAALAGNSPFSRALEVPKTKDNPRGKASGWQKVQAAVNSAAGASIPWYAFVQRVAEGGGTPYANSLPWAPKTKPNTDHMSGLRRAADPFRPTYLKQPKSAGPPLSPAQQRQFDRVSASQVLTPEKQAKIDETVARILARQKAKGK